MIRIVMMIAIWCSLSLWGKVSDDALNASLHSLESQESIETNSPLVSILGKYENLLPELSRRYEKTHELRNSVEEKFKEAGIPVIFALIPYCESKYNPSAKGNGTAGLWQFNRNSAKNFGLSIKKHNDQRLDPNHSTYAAIRYLKSLKNEFGSWYLADFAYTMGAGKLKKIIEKNHSTDIAVLLKDPSFSTGAKAHFAQVLLLSAHLKHDATTPQEG